MPHAQAGKLVVKFNVFVEQLCYEFVGDFRIITKQECQHFDADPYVHLSNAEKHTEEWDPCHNKQLYSLQQEVQTNWDLPKRTERRQFLLY